MKFSPRVYLVAANLVLLALVAYSASAVIGTAVAARLYVPPQVPLKPPPAPKPQAAVQGKNHYDVIVHRNLITDPPPKKEPAPSNEKVAPPRNVKLWGVALKGADSYCILEDVKAKKQELHRLDTTVPGLGRVARVEWDRCIIQTAKGETVLEIARPDELASKPPPRARGRRATRASRFQVNDENIEEVAENEYVIAREEVDNALENMSRLFTQVRAVPHFEGGESTGFRLFAIRHGSLFDKIGLKNGDILHSINGLPMTDPTEALAMLERLRDAADLDVSITRNRQAQRLSYRIE